MNMKKIFLSAVSIFTLSLMLFTSCSNLAGDLGIDSNSQEGFLISGTVIPYNSEETSARTAFPSDPVSGTYYYTIKAVCGSDTVTQDLYSDYGTAFAINIPHKGDWNVTAECFANPARTELHYKTAKAVTVSITASNPHKNINLKLKPVMTAEGTGTFDLTIVTDGISNTPYNFETSSPNTFTATCTSSNAADINEKFSFTAAGSNLIFKSKTGENIKSGSYTFDLNFYSTSGAILFSTTQIVNVYDYLVTNKWVKQGDEAYLVDDGSGNITFKLTTALLDKYRLTTIYVDSNAPDGGDGGWLYPYNNLDTAIEAFNDSNSVVEKIYISGNCTATKSFNFVNITNRDLTIKKHPNAVTRPKVYSTAASSLFMNNRKKLVIDGIDFEGQGIKDTDPSTGFTNSGINSAFLYNYATGEVEISNCNISNFKSDSCGIIYNTKALTLTNVTISNCKTNGDGGVIYAGGSSDSNVTLINSSISACSAKNGGGIYINAGTVTIDENSVIGKTGVTSYATEDTGKYSNKCADNGHGGGVYIATAGKLINNGKISYNLNGGVYVTGAGNLENNGEISYNGFTSDHSDRKGGGVCYENITQIRTLTGKILNNFAQNGGGVCFAVDNPGVHLIITGNIENNYGVTGSGVYAASSDSSAANILYLDCKISGNQDSGSAEAIHIYNVEARLSSDSEINNNQRICVENDSTTNNAKVYMASKLTKISQIRLVPDSTLTAGYPIIQASSAGMLSLNLNKITMDDSKTFGLIESGYYEYLTRNYYVRANAAVYANTDGSYDLPYPLLSTALSKLPTNTTAATIYVDGTIYENAGIVIDTALNNISICKWPGASVTNATIKRGGNTTASILKFNKENLNILMEGITIDGSDTELSDVNGAGIYCDIGDGSSTDSKSALTLKNVTIVGCKTKGTAANPTAGYGGAIYCKPYDPSYKYYSVTLEGCTIGNSSISEAPASEYNASNSAYNGGGIYLSGAYIKTNIIDTTIAGNYAANYGGAIYGQSFTIERSNVIKNCAKEYGGAIFATGFNFNSGLISGNKALTGPKSAGVNTLATFNIYDGASFGPDDTVYLRTDSCIRICSENLTGTFIAKIYCDSAAANKQVLTSFNEGYIAANCQKFTYDGPFEIIVSAAYSKKGVLKPVAYVDMAATSNGSGTKTSPYNKLISAVDAIEAGGTIFVSGSGNEDNAVTINKNLTIDQWSGKTAAVITGRRNTTEGSLISIANGKTVTIQNISLKGPVTTYGGINGGLINNAGTLTLTDVKISDSLVSSNDGSDGLGGGIYNEGTLTMTRGSVSGCQAYKGGGIYNNGTCTLLDVSVTGNWTWTRNYSGSSLGMGAGIYNAAGSLTLKGTNATGISISNNGTHPTSQEDVFKTKKGGGIYIAGGTFSTQKSSTSKIIISSNKANQGAGIYSAQEITLGEISITNNTAIVIDLNGGQGGGICMDNKPLTIAGAEIKGNTAVGHLTLARGTGIFTTSTINMSGTDSINVNNDVHLSGNDSAINIISSLTATGTIAKVTVDTPDERTTAVLTGTETLVADNFGKFDLTHGNTYYITSEGKINQKLESEELFALLTEVPTDTSKVYIMDTQAEFEKLSTWVSAGNFLAGIHLKLNSNITVTGTWTPILKFSGIFDGNNKSIALETQSYSDEINVGLFGSIDNAEVRNITVYGNITNSYQYFATTGAIAGKAINSTIIGCTNNATINGRQFTGGIVGCTDNTDISNPPQGTTTISNCTNTGNVTGSQFTGGIVGWHNGQDISNCTNTGAIVATTNVGQIVGTNSPGAPVTGSTESGSATTQ